MAKKKTKSFSFDISEQRYLHRPQGGKDTKTERNGNGNLEKFSFETIRFATIEDAQKH